MKILKPLTAAVMAALCGCSTSDMPFPKNDMATTTSGYEIGLDEAQESLSTILNDIDGTRSSNRRVASVELIKGTTLTRSGASEPATLYYIINYENEQGFGLMSADRRLAPVYAFSDQGSLSLADTVRNPMLKAFFDALPKAVSSTRNSAEPLLIDPGEIGPVKPKFTSIVAPLIARPVQKWDQLKYNKYVRQFCNNDASTPVGCVAVSTAIIMSYFNHPSTVTIKNRENNNNTTYTFDWAAINSGSTAAHDNICRLMEVLGRPDLLNITYGTGTTGSTSVLGHVYKNVYNKMGYYSPLFLSYFKPTTVKQNLLKNIPVQLTGTGHLKDNDSIVRYDHSWVIDGYGTLKEFMFEYNQMIDRELYHFVWGNGDRNNGYYAYLTGIPDGLEDLFEDPVNTDKGYFDDGKRYYEDYESNGSLGAFYHNLKLYYNFQIK